MTAPDDPIGVGADQPIGSERLAAALASGDAEAIGRALRFDVVVVPLVRGDDGATQIRVFEFEGASLQLVLFSSVATFAAFLAGDPAREFDLQRGTALAPFLDQYRDRIVRVVFDPAGPHPVAAPVDAVLESLRPRPDDDEVAWLAGGDGSGAGAQTASSARPGTAATGSGEVIDFRLAMPLRGWTRIPASDVLEYPKHAVKQLRGELRRMPRAERAGAIAWLEAVIGRVAGADGAREVGTTVDLDGGATPVLLARYWRPGADIATARGAADVGTAGESIAPFVVDGAEFGIVRTSEPLDAAAPGGRRSAVEVVLPWPDGGGACVVLLASPASDRHTALLRIATAIIGGGSWVTRSRA